MAVTWKKIAYEGDCLLEADFAAKGDILSASAASTLEVLSVGTDGKALVADSGEASGLNWGAPAAAAHYLDSHAAEAGHDGELIRSNADSSALEWKTPAEIAGTMRLNEFAAPDGTVDFDLQEATDLVVMTVANEAALPAANIALGQLCWATGELSLHICSSIA